VTYTGAITPALPVVVNPLNNSFETPNVGSGVFEAFALNPDGAGWLFEGNAGVAGNGSGYTAFNPAAPQGAQVALLQDVSRMAQTIDGWQAGTYTLSLKAAQRGDPVQTAPNTFRVLIDGQIIGEYTPADANYATITTPEFTVSAGSHTVEIVTLNPAGVDSTVLIDDVQISGLTSPTQQSIAAGSLDVGDIVITGPNGLSQSATGIAFEPGDAPVKVVTYTVPAPAEGWSDAGTASLAIHQRSSQVATTVGGFVPAGRIGTLTVAVNAPAAAVTASDVPPTLLTEHTFQVTYTSAAVGLPASIDSNDLRVLGPAGYNQPATLVSFFGEGTTTSPLVATYSVPPPATGWAVGANGVYAIIAQAGQVVDSNGNALPAGQIGQFAVNVDRASPIATTTTATINSVATTSRTVFVNYYDVSGINQSTLDGNDLLVTGPNGFSSTLARTGTITQRGLSLRVPYVLAAPAGGWKSRMNGTYTITLQPGQVADNNGITATTARQIGTFDVALETTPPTVSITPVSPSPRNTAVSSLTLTYSEQTVGFDLSDLSLTRDGSPVSLAGATLTLTKASTSSDPTEVWTLGNLSGLTATDGTYTLTDAAGGVEDLAGNVQVSAATQTWTTDVTRPTAFDASAVGVMTPAATVTITVTFADNMGLNAASINTGDLLVSGPNGYSATPTLQALSGVGNNRTATFVVPTPSGGWRSFMNGTYNVELLGGSVTDHVGNGIARNPSLVAFSVSLETVAPTASFSPIESSTRVDPPTALTLNFSEPVSGFDLADLALTRDNSTVPLTGVLITQTGVASYVVTGLPSSSATGFGNYALSLIANGSGITDAAGNALTSGATISYQLVPATPPAGSILINGGFESPTIGYGLFRYAPAGTGWTFDGNTGVAGNSSAFSANNPDAPEGVQVAFLQQVGVISGQVEVLVPATYTLTFQAAQRGNWQAVRQDFQAWVNDRLLGTYTPDSTAYQSFTAASLPLAAGIHTLRFVGLNSAGGDNSALIDDVRLTAASADVTPPTATFAAISPNPRTQPVQQITATFNEPVIGLDASDFSLTRDGSAVPLAGLSFGAVDERTYTIAIPLAATASPGNYVLTLSAGGVYDLSGNSLANAVSTSWSTLLPAPTLTGVSPNPVAGSPFAQLITLTGTSFTSDAAVVIRNTVTGQIAGGVSIVSRTAGQIVVSATLGSAAANWTAEVSTASGTSAALPFSTTAAAPVNVSASLASDGKSVTLGVTGVPSGLNYAWTVVSSPAGMPLPLFAVNNSAAASTTTAVFAAAGQYVFQVVASDGSGTASGTVSVNVTPILSALNVTPGSANLAANATQQFSASGTDQFGNTMTPPNLRWELFSGAGTMSAGGLYTAPSTATSAVIRAVSGTWIKSAIVTVAASTTFKAVKIDFVPSSAPVASGYVRDGGSTYGNRGNGYTYGWSVSHTDAAIDRNLNSNQLLDANIGVKSGARWQLQVPNGRYTVRVGVGDASVVTTNTVRVEGTTLYSAVRQAANVFSSRSVTVSVNDGVLTIDAGSAANLATRITHIEVSPATTTTSPSPTPAFTSAAIDFAPATATLASGYVRDSGSTYGSRGNNLTYGWDVSHTSNVFDRDRNSSQLLDTTLLAKSNAKWEIAVPNGTYTVRVGVGDAANSSNNTVRVENSSLFSSVALAANTFSSRTVTVTVSDGRLTLQVGSADLLTRLTHVEVTRV
jgi:fibronectin type 3 domain-containing protein